MAHRYLVTTIDTEVDKRADWSISDPASFRSVTEAIPEVLTPLFDRYGVRPTYLLSPEVIENDDCAAALGALGDRAELGTHLHAELVTPHRRLDPCSMSGARADMLQGQLDRELEAAKLRDLTALFTHTFGRPPQSFRSGRFGMSPHTLELLSGLGYIVDSSITPGIRWRYAEGTIDHRSEPTAPQWRNTRAGSILEVPVSVWPRTRVAQWAHHVPAHAERLVRGALRPIATYEWLRPSWGNARELMRCAERHTDQYLVAMFHSMELVPGASPYAQDERDVQRILSALEALLVYCQRSGITSSTLSEVPTHFSDERGRG